MADYYQQRPKFGQNNGGYSNRNQYGQQAKPETPTEFFNKIAFDDNWIKIGADEKLPEFAEKIGKYMAENGLTNSKIRSIYGEIKRIQMGEFDKEKASFYLLKPKVAYALGRDPQNKGLQLFKIVFEKSSSLVTDQKTYQNFCNLLEAILAYHKANGGKD